MLWPGLARPSFCTMVSGRRSSPYPGVDQRHEVADRLRSHDSRTGVQVEPRHLVLRGHHALHHRHEALYVEQLVERQLDIARFQTVDRRRPEIDSANGDLAWFFSGLVQHFGEYPGDAAVLRADRLEIGIVLHVR